MSQPCVLERPLAQLLGLAAGMLNSIQDDDLGHPEFVERMRALHGEIQRANDRFAQAAATITEAQEFKRLYKKIGKFTDRAKEVAWVRLAALPPLGPPH